MASNRMSVLIESMLLDKATRQELDTFYDLIARRRKGAATCYALRVLRKYWAEMINQPKYEDVIEPKIDSFNLHQIALDCA